MAFPAGASTITVTGTFPAPVDGAARDGQVIFTPSAVLVDATQHAIYSGGGPVTLDDSGHFTTQLLCTDDTDLQPTGWRWRVEERPLGGVRRPPYFIDLPAALGPSIDLSELAAVDAPDGTTGGDGLTPTGPAGGALTGTYPNPTLSTATVAQFDPAGAAATAQATAVSTAATEATGKANAAQAAAISAAATYSDAQTATRVPTSRQVTAGTGLTGGGALSADRSFAVAYGTSGTTACAGNDGRLSDPRTPTSHAASHGTGGSDVLTPAAIGAYPASSGATVENRATALEQIEPDLPSDQNLLAWTYDPNMAGHVTAQSNSGVAGRITLVRLILRKQITWSNVWIGLSGVDAAAVLANCYLGVYDSSGTLKGVTADISTSLMTGATAKPLALTSPFTAAPGSYFIAMLLNGTWATNSLTFKASGAGVSVNAGLSAPNLRYSNLLTGQTSLPSTLTLSGQTTTIITTGWASQWYGVS